MIRSNRKGNDFRKTNGWRKQHDGTQLSNSDGSKHPGVAEILCPWSRLWHKPPIKLPRSDPVHKYCT